jgi:PAS domain S-box-containing protein
MQLQDKVVLQAMVRDVTESKRTEEALKRAYEQLERRVEERTSEFAETNLQLNAEIDVRTRAETELRENERKLSILMANLPGMAYRCRNDRDWTMEFVSDGCFALTGYFAENLIENRKIRYADIILPDDRKEVWQQVQAAIKEKRRFRFEYRIQTAKGDTRWVWEQGIGIFAEEGELLALEGFIADITDRKEAQVNMEEANRELEAFAYTVSHDLRTPLTPIIGYAQIMKEMYKEFLDEKALGFLSEIETQGDKMLVLMENLLALATVGHLERPAEPVSAGEVVLEVIKNLENRIAECGVTVTQKPLPAIRVSKSLLTQLFDNLIGNAIRYAGKEDARIEVDGERSGNRVRLLVRDHGPGIPVKERARIFEVFYRGATGKSVSGSGVGLATVKKIAKLYGGRAWVEETPGGGATFCVEMEG